MYISNGCLFESLFCDMSQPTRKRHWEMLIPKTMFLKLFPFSDIKVSRKGNRLVDSAIKLRQNDLLINSHYNANLIEGYCSSWSCRYQEMYTVHSESAIFFQVWSESITLEVHLDRVVLPVFGQPLTVYSGRLHLQKYLLFLYIFKNCLAICT